MKKRYRWRSVLSRWVVCLLTVNVIAASAGEFAGQPLSGRASADPAASTFEARAAALLEYFDTHSPEEAPIQNGVDNRYKNYAKYHTWIAEASLELGNLSRGLEMAEEALTRTSDIFDFYSAMDSYLRYKDLYTPEMRELAKTVIGGHPSGAYDGGSTENHHLMHSVARYLAGQEWPEVADHVGADKGRDWLLAFFDRVPREGIMEQDSSTYMPTYTSALLSLIDHAADNEMRIKAKLTYDWLLAQWAPEWLKGYHVTSSFRMSTPEFEPKHPSESLIVGWLYFGGEQPATFMRFLESNNEWYPDGIFAISAAISSYRPPAAVTAAALERTADYVHRETSDVGGDNAEGFKRYTYINKEYGVTSTYNGYGGGPLYRDQVHEGQVKWVSDQPNSTFFINQPLKDTSNANVQGQLRVDGATGNLQTLQYKGTQVSVIKMKSSDAYPYLRGLVSTTALNGVLEQDGWIFMDAGPVYIAAKMTAGSYAFFEDDGRYRWFKNTALQNGIIIETAPAADYAALQDFADAVKLLPVDASGVSAVSPSLTFTNLEGKVMTITYGGTRSVDGAPYDYANWPLLDNPWMQQERQGVLTLQTGSGTCTYNYAVWSTACPSGTPAQPDLVVNEIGWTPDNPATGDSVVLQAEVQNLGTAAIPAASGAVLQFNVNGTAAATVPLPALQPGEKAVVSAGSTQSWQPPAAGTYTITAIADAGGQLTEAQEHNNTRISKLVLWNTAFAEPFDSGAAAGWSTTGGPWTAGVSEAVYRATALNGLQLASYTGSGWSNYFVKTNMRIDGTGSGATPSAGLVGRYQDANNMYYLRYNWTTAQLQLLKIVNGQNTILRSVSQTIDNGTWHTFGLRFEGTTITAYLDGVQRFILVDAGLSTGGIGLRAYNAAASFDNVLVQTP
ncbi:CARDB domain-containing protein [Paenibacillus sp. FSL R7-0333]|uniref:CARDB domain-containing protein n=1 Tax=Paenibacillus sp. FSL R7-0333 TaxID=1926587 RepID=UPI0009FB14F7